MLCVFSPEDRERLIEELNQQIDNDEFYKMDSINTVNISAGKPSFTTSVSSQFKGVGLFRPLITSDYNPFKSNVYHYDTNVQASVHGIAFSSQSSEPVERLVKEPQHVLIKEIAKNTYSITDILQNTSDSDVISFNAIPKELALTKKNTIKDFLFQPIDVVGAFKKVFHFHQ